VDVLPGGFISRMASLSGAAGSVCPAMIVFTPSFSTSFTVSIQSIRCA
jgi:hypothetical protein